MKTSRVEVCESMTDLLTWENTGERSLQLGGWLGQSQPGLPVGSRFLLVSKD